LSDLASNIASGSNGAADIPKLRAIEVKLFRAVSKKALSGGISANKSLNALKTTLASASPDGALLQIVVTTLRISSTFCPSDEPLNWDDKIG